MANKKLNARQRQFAEFYVVNPNATQAAKRAGYSERTAYSIGQENLKKPEIAALIEVMRAERSERTRIEADRVLREVARLAFTDMASFVEWDEKGVRIKPSADLSVDDTAAITEIGEQGRGTGKRLKIKLGHKDSALRMLMEHLGLLGGSSEDMKKLADTFLAGAETVRKMEARDLSEG